MINILFWNVNRKSAFEQVISDVVGAESIDILILAEAMEVDDARLELLSGLKREKVTLDTDEIKLTPKIFSSRKGFNLDHYQTYPNTKRMVFYMLDIPNRKPILIASLHLRSKIMRNFETQTAEASKYSSFIKEIEDDERRTIVVGDFNANPFELGIISPLGFNATGSKKIAERVVRDFMKDDYPYFYTPMWNCLGDTEYGKGNPKLPGSYFFDNNQSVSITYWNVFDNLLVRPSLFKEVDMTSATFLESSSTHSFVNKSGSDYLIDNINYSDHLPLKFKII